MEGKLDKIEGKYFIINNATEKILIPFHSITRIVETQRQTSIGIKFQCEIYQLEFDNPLHFDGSINDFIQKSFRV